jgi:CRISPR-associated protein Cmr5
MPNETNMKKLENGRAEFAYKCVEAIKTSSDYKSYVKKVPVLIQTNGLGNTLAYMVSKGKAYDLIYQHLMSWLSKEECGCKALPDHTDLLAFVVSQPSMVYRQITTECLALLNWLRRLAEGMIEGDDNET